MWNELFPNLSFEQTIEITVRLSGFILFIAGVRCE